MQIDLIKEYLVGIGFKIDENSFNQTKSSINEADKTINKFNKNSQKGFSDTANVMKDFLTLFKSSGGDLGKMFPELQEPLQGLIKTIVFIKKTYVDLVKQMENQNPKIKIETEQETKSIHNANNTGNSKSNLPSVRLKSTEAEDSAKDLVNGMTDVKNAASGLAEEGGEALGMFSAEAVGALGATTAGIGLLIAAVGVLAAEWVKFFNGLAQQDIEYEKLSRQLWTTKENAKEVDMALKTMGVTMQDLWLSPTLLKQFNQLRKDSAELKLPKEYTDNLKVVQGIGAEFLRLRQLAQLAFQWIGNYILKYAAGPLNDLRQTIKSFNDWLVKSIPGIGKSIGDVVKVTIRLMMALIKLIEIIIKSSPIVQIIKLIPKIQEAFENLPEPIRKTIKAIILILTALTQPILVILALIDDLMTYFKGGKSLTGTFLDKFSKMLDSVKSKIQSIIDWFKNLKKEILNSDFVKGIEGFVGGVEKVSNDIRKGDFKGLLNDLNTKINGVSSANMNNLVSSYTTSNIRNMSTSSTTTQNSHNTIKNDNKFYVYGGNDANSTGKAVKNNVNGLILRNLQGGY